MIGWAHGWLWKPESLKTIWLTIEPKTDERETRSRFDEIDEINDAFVQVKACAWAVLNELVAWSVADEMFDY